MKMLCDYPFTHFEVNNPNGDVTFCCNHNMVLGNVNRSSIEEIWNGKAYKQVRRRFLDGRIFDVCSRKCPVLGGWKDFEKLDWYNELSKESAAYKNAVLNNEEIRVGKVELESKPRWLRFSASYACNLKCYHCFQGMDRKASLELPNSFFEEAKRKLESAQIIFFYGGEPLIEKRNLDMMDYAGERGFSAKVYIISNGTVLNDKIKNTLEKLNFGFMDISVDSIKKELYEELRYLAKWPDTAKNLKFFSELMRNKKGNLSLTFTINKKNQSELVNFVKFSMELGAVPFFQFAHNVFKDEFFRKNYEIYSIKEYMSAKRNLLEVKEFLASTNLDYTRKNVDYLLRSTSFLILIGKKLRAFASENVPWLKNFLVKLRGNR